MISVPETSARSAHNRAAVWNAIRCRGQQKRWRDPPRRGPNGFAHHQQVASAIAEAPCMTHMTQRDGSDVEGAVARGRMYARVEALSWGLRHCASWLIPAG